MTRKEIKLTVSGSKVIYTETAEGRADRIARSEEAAMKLLVLPKGVVASCAKRRRTTMGRRIVLREVWHSEGPHAEYQKESWQQYLRRLLTKDNDDE